MLTTYFPQKQKSNGGGFGDRGDRGGRGRGGYQRDYDSPGHGQSSNNQYSGGDRGASAAQAPQLGADGQADPYAPCEYKHLESSWRSMC